MKRLREAEAELECGRTRLRAWHEFLTRAMADCGSHDLHIGHRTKEDGDSRLRLRAQQALDALEAFEAAFEAHDYVKAAAIATISPPDAGLLSTTVFERFCSIPLELQQAAVPLSPLLLYCMALLDSHPRHLDMTQMSLNCVREATAQGNVDVVVFWLAHKQLIPSREAARLLEQTCTCASCCCCGWTPLAQFLYAQLRDASGDVQRLIDRRSDGPAGCINHITSQRDFTNSLSE